MDSVVYAKEPDSGHHLLGLYFMVLWKGYLEEENTWKPTLVVLDLCKLMSTFHHDHLEKLIAISPPIDSSLPMARPTVKPWAEALSTKQKQSGPIKANNTSKRTKKSWTSTFHLAFSPVSIAGKRSPQSHDFKFRSTPLRLAVLFSILPHFSIFTHFSVFPPRQRPRDFFYQSLKSFGFPLSVLQRVRCFSLSDLPVFLYHLPLGFWRFFIYNVILWSHVTSHVMDLTRSGQFHIITHPEVS